MELNPIEGFLWGFFGGIAANFVGSVRLFKENPRQISGWLRYRRLIAIAFLVVFILAAIGGVLVVAYIRSNHQLTPILAINVGASAPLFFNAASERVPPIEPGKRIN